MQQFFKLSSRRTTVRTEIFAGLTTFMAMAYILMVNAGMFAQLEVVSYGAIYIATAISAIVGTVLIGLLSNLPLAQASGMGLNAFFVFTVCFGLGFSYANALVLVLFDGLLFIVFSITGLRKIIFDAIPAAVKVAIPAGIGLFIAFIGLQSAKLIIPDASTGVTLASFNVFLGNATWAGIMPIVVTIVTILAIAIMSKKNVKGAVFFGILGGSVLYYLLGFTIPEFYSAITFNFNPIAAFQDFFSQSFLKVFTEGFNFSAYISANGMTNFIIVFVTTSLAFCLVDMFDTMGTLFGACARGNLLTKEGDVPKMNQAMLADAIATTTGAICGTSTVTTYVESSAGIAEGGRTGLTSLSTAFFFFVAMFFSPIAELIPGCATAAALIYVGVLMMNSVKFVDWLDPSAAVPAFLTVAIMPFAYNISYGIAFGLISFVFIKLFTGEAKYIKISTWIIMLLFLAMFLLTH